MNKQEYILKLKKLKAIVDEHILQAIDDDNILSKEDEIKIKKNIIVPIWKIMPPSVKKWKIFLLVTLNELYINTNIADETIYHGEYPEGSDMANRAEYDFDQNWHEIPKNFQEKYSEFINNSLYKTFDLKNALRLIIESNKKNFLVTILRKK